MGTSKKKLFYGQSFEFKKNEKSPLIRTYERQNWHSPPIYQLFVVPSIPEDRLRPLQVFEAKEIVHQFH